MKAINTEKHTTQGQLKNENELSREHTQPLSHELQDESAEIIQDSVNLRRCLPTTFEKPSFK